MKGCIKGDSNARRELYERYAAQMLSVCYRYAHNSEDAKDIFQQAFYLVYKNIDQLKDHKALSGWIKRIFVNTALQYYKKNHMMFALQDFSSNELDLLDTMDPLSKMAEKELIELIQALPGGCREVFNLYVVDGYSHKEIAERLNISVGTSKSQLFDARRLLKKAILRNNKPLTSKKI